MRTRIDAHWWKAHYLATTMRDNGIYLDDSFQSYHRWVTENNQQYMRSLLNGKAPTSYSPKNKGKSPLKIPKKKSVIHLVLLLPSMVIYL